MFKLIISSLWDFKKSWRKYLLFSFFYLFLSSYILIPFLGYFLNRLLLLVSSGVLINSSAFSLLLDPKAIIGLILLSSLAVFFTFIQVGTLIILAHKNNFNKEILISEGILTSIVSIRRMLGLGALYLALLFFLIIPIVDIPVMPEMSKLIGVPPLLLDTIMESVLTRSLYFITVALFIYLLLRLIFTLHEVLIEKQKVWSAMKTSMELTKKISYILLFKLLLFDIVVFSLGTLFFTFLSSLPEILDIQVNYIIRNYLVTLSSYLTFIYSMILIPLNIIFITKLYNQIKGEDLTEDRLQTYNFHFLATLEKKLFILLKKKKIFLPLILVFSIVATFFLGFSVNQNTIYAGRDVAVIAHRGVVNEEFENSLDGIRASLEADIDIVELDIMMTKDEVIILHHDLSLRRTFGYPYQISDVTYEEISSLGLNLSSDLHADDPVPPTLSDALETISGEMDILLDVKTKGNYEVFAKELVQTIEDHNMVENAYIQSFNNSLLVDIQQLNPDIQTSQIMYYSIGNITALEVDYYTAHRGMLSHNFVQKARQKDKGIWVWTANTEDAIKEVLKYDIDGIITSRPMLAMEILGRSVDEEMIED